jgi:hypothetical protein
MPGHAVHSLAALSTLARWSVLSFRSCFETRVPTLFANRRLRSAAWVAPVAFGLRV